MPGGNELQGIPFPELADSSVMPFEFGLIDKPQQIVPRSGDALNIGDKTVVQFALEQPKITHPHGELAEVVPLVEFATVTGDQRTQHSFDGASGRIDRQCEATLLQQDQRILYTFLGTLAVA